MVNNNMLTCLSKIAMGVVMVCEELVHCSPSMEQLHDLSEDDIITYGPSSLQTATVMIGNILLCC